MHHSLLVNDPLVFRPNPRNLVSKVRDPTYTVVLCVGDCYYCVCSWRRKKRREIVRKKRRRMRGPPNNPESMFLLKLLPHHTVCMCDVSLHWSVGIPVWFFFRGRGGEEGKETTATAAEGSQKFPNPRPPK